MVIFQSHISGFILLLLVISLSLVAWRKLQNDQISQSLIVIVFLGLILRCYPAMDFRLHDWDEQYHALVAKHLADHPLRPTLYENPLIVSESKNWVGNHIWLEKPPVALWGIAASIKIFGASSWAVRLPSLVYGLLAILLTYGIGSLLLSKRIGIFAAYLHAINGFIIELGAGRISSDHVETALIFFVELAVFLLVCFSQNNRNRIGPLLIGLVTGIAFLCKWYPAGLVIPIWLLSFLLFHKFSFRELFIQGTLLTVAFLVTVSPWLLYINEVYPKEAHIVLGKFLGAYSSPVENHKAEWYYYLHKIMVLFGELIYLVLAFSIYQVVKKNKQKEILILLAWISIPIIIFSFGETKRFSYLLITAPPFFILTGNLWFFLFDHAKAYSKKWLINAFLIILIILPLRLTIERVKPFEIVNKGNWPFYENITNYDEILGPKDVVFGSENAIRLMFFTDVAAAYTYIPSPDQINSLKSREYSIYYLINYELIKQ